MSEQDSAARFREAREQITGDSWADDMARASISAAEAKFGPKPEHETYVTPESFRVSLAPDACYVADRENMRHWAMHVDRLSAHYWCESDGWIVVGGHGVVSRGGGWDYGPQDEASRAAWLESHVYRTAGMAIDAAREFAPKVTINDLTAVEQMARHRARNLGCCRG